VVESPRHPAAILVGARDAVKLCAHGERGVGPSVNQTSIDVIASALEPLAPELGRLSSPDGSVTLMLSDIAGADVLAASLGPERWERLVSDHHLLVERLVAHHDGQVIRFEADGFLASFNSAHGGLHAAVELQQMVGASGTQVRVGLHSGFVLPGDGAPLGRNVVLASRIAGMAAGGEILVSAEVREYTRSDPSFRFAPRGEHHFKGLIGEYDVFQVERGPA
jgi:class 3 adenylate cyclase